MTLLAETAGLDLQVSDMVYFVFFAGCFIIVGLMGGWYNEYLSRKDFENAYFDEYDEKLDFIRRNEALVTQVKYYKQRIEEVHSQSGRRKVKK